MTSQQQKGDFASQEGFTVGIEPHPTPTPPPTQRVSHSRLVLKGIVYLAFAFLWSIAEARLYAATPSDEKKMYSFFTCLTLTGLQFASFFSEIEVATAAQRASGYPQDNAIFELHLWRRLVASLFLSPIVVAANFILLLRVIAVSNRSEGIFPFVRYLPAHRVEALRRCFSGPRQETRVPQTSTASTLSDTKLTMSEIKSKVLPEEVV
ncbi:hypothetical protein V5O48_008904 [Marasmius crinis-equi]|uniref:Transmembrane protein n=1 Tax=Marasmius crinis-equi TaxID=585013 RepID=A0ABR3FCN7_9AGAR